MAVTYGFYNAINHDRLYDAIQMSSIFDGIIRDGIFSTIGDTMIVTAPEDGMYVNVGSGRAWFNHTWTLNDTDYPIEAEEAEVVLDRIDAVILEVNSSAEVRANSIKFLKGTPSSNPVKPTLTHNAEVNQYALAYVRIRAGQTTIFQSDIENAVGTDETPLVTGVLQQVSIETLLKQWEAEFNTYFTNFKNTSTTEFNNWFAAKVSEYTAWFAQMQTDMDSNFNEFDAWFQRMKDQLDENQAGHLQLQIDNLSGRIDDLDAEMPFAGGSKVNINFEYDVVPNIQYSNEHYKLTVGDTVRENNFSSNKLHFDEYGILTVGDGILEVTYDITDSRTGKITPASYTYTINMPYFGRFIYNVTISASLYDYQGWLYSIGKDPNQYSTIEDVFADEKLLRELMTRHASVDYLVEWLANNNEDAHTVLNNDYCAKWINLRDYALDKLYANPTVKAVMDEVDKYGYGEWALVSQVPTLTSNTGSNGVASASGVYGSYKIYSAFDNDASTEWFSETGTSEHYIQYKFNAPILIDKVNIKAGAGQGKPSKFTIDVSTDGNEFITIKEILSSDWADGVSYDISLDNNTPYLCYRVTLKELSTTSSSSSIREFRLYAWQPKGNVPVMTSNTAPYGEARASSEYASDANNAAFGAFTENGGWATENYESGKMHYIQYKFTNPILVSRVRIARYNYAYTLSNVVLKGSNNGVDWTTICSNVNYDSTSEEVKYTEINTDTYYLYLRIEGTAGSSGGGAKLLQFYGRQLNVSVPTMTSNTAPFGELLHGGEESTEFAVWKAFDKNNNSRASQYPSLDGNSGVGYYGYDFGSDTVVKFVTEYSTNTNELATGLKYYLEGSSDKNTWTKVREFTSNAQGSNAYSDVNSNNQAFRYWRMTAYSGGGNGRARNSTCLFYNELQFYGIDYSEREFGEGSTMKYLYDHGVEIIGITGSVTSNVSNFEKKSDCLYLEFNGSNSSATFLVDQKVDLTPYKILRCHNGKIIYSTHPDYIALLAIKGTLPLNGLVPPDAAAMMLARNIPDNVYIDISSINSEKYIAFTIGSGTGPYVMKASITEWWLE